jgi:hypothetical protein
VRVAVAVVAVLWGVGFVRFLTAPRAVTIALPVLSPHPPGEHDVAAARFGPTVRVSSYLADVYNQHHPAFLVDERQSPTRVEKWASDVGDRAPWVEIRWRGAHDVSRVVIDHAGAFEDHGMTSRAYSITCLTAAGTGPALAVHDNTAQVATHPIDCRAAVGLRVDFAIGDNDVVRVYEIAAWGR